MEKNELAPIPTAYLVDLATNRKIPITTPRCRVGRDDLNEISIKGDQSIASFQFIITYENGQYQAQDANTRLGTFLDGRRITGPESIKHGNVLKAGVSLFWFGIEADSEPVKDELLRAVDVDKVKGGKELPHPNSEHYSFIGWLRRLFTQKQ
jgi:pSer/pThr/pTyr-binding forkhead associated (FHA) protein